MAPAPLQSPLVDIRKRLVDTSNTPLFTVDSPTRSYWRIDLARPLQRHPVAASPARPTRRPTAPRRRSRDPPPGSRPRSPRSSRLEQLVTEWLPAAYRPLAFRPRRRCVRALRRRDDHLHPRRRARRRDLLRRSRRSSPTSPPSSSARPTPSIPSERPRARSSCPTTSAETAAQLAEAVAGDAPTPYDSAMALQDFFRRLGRLHLQHRRRRRAEQRRHRRLPQQSRRLLRAVRRRRSRRWPAASGSRPGSPSATRGARPIPPTPTGTRCSAATPTPGPRSTSASTAGCRSSRPLVGATPMPRATPGCPARRTPRRRRRQRPPPRPPRTRRPRRPRWPPQIQPVAPDATARRLRRRRAVVGAARRRDPPARRAGLPGRGTRSPRRPPSPPPGEGRRITDRRGRGGVVGGRRLVGRCRCPGQARRDAHGAGRRGAGGLVPGAARPLARSLALGRRLGLRPRRVRGRSDGCRRARHRRRATPSTPLWARVVASAGSSTRGRCGRRGPAATAPADHPSRRRWVPPAHAGYQSHPYLDDPGERSNCRQRLQTGGMGRPQDGRLGCQLRDGARSSATAPSGTEQRRAPPEVGSGCRRARRGPIERSPRA